LLRRRSRLSLFTWLAGMMYYHHIAQHYTGSAMYYGEDSYSDSLTDSQWRTAAVQQYAADRGQFRPDQAWILSPYDTWEPNPFYIGPRQPHPEGDEPPV